MLGCGLTASPDARFHVGQTMTLRGSATDAKDGTVPDSAVSWQVLLHHDAHTHPFLGPQPGNSITFTAPAPEDLAAAANSFLEIRLTATDLAGLTSTTSRELRPATTPVRLATEPAGLVHDQSRY